MTALSPHTQTPREMPQGRARTPMSGWRQGMCALSGRERVRQTKDSVGPGSLGAPTDTLRFTTWDVLQGDGDSRKPQDWERAQNVPEGEEAQCGSQHGPGQKRWGREATRDSLAVSPGREPSPGSWGDTRLARDPPKAREMDDQPSIRGTTDPRTTWTRLWRITWRAAANPKGSHTVPPTPFTQKS